MAVVCNYGCSSSRSIYAFKSGPFTTIFDHPKEMFQLHIGEVLVLFAGISSIAVIANIYSKRLSVVNPLFLSSEKGLTGFKSESLCTKLNLLAGSSEWFPQNPLIPSRYNLNPNWGGTIFFGGGGKKRSPKGFVEHV